MTNLDMNRPVKGIGDFAGVINGRRHSAAAQTAQLNADIAARLDAIAAACPPLAKLAQAGRDVVAATAPASRASAPKHAPANKATQNQNKRRSRNGLGMNQ